jgi:hypothetical protein
LGQSCGTIIHVKVVTAISCIAAVGDVLAVASHRHLAMHLINFQGHVMVRLIGHAAPVMNLLPLSSKGLLSGSRDDVVQKWEDQEIKIEFAANQGQIMAIGARSCREIE